MDPAAPMRPVSNGKGATTCSYFFPGDKQVLFASTQLGGDFCPPRPDHSQGYVWALYDSYDIFTRGTPMAATWSDLTSTPRLRRGGHRVQQGDGSIVFTSWCATATSSSTAWTRTGRT